MIRAHFLDTDAHQFSHDERDLIARVCADSESEVRSHLPLLAGHLNVLVEPGTGVIPETGEVGFAMSPHAIRWTVDPARGVVAVVTEHLSHTLFHEAYHAARLVPFPGEAYTSDWRTAAISEGLATVFERDVAGFDPPYGAYDSDVIAQWADELFAQPVDHTFNDWKFQHPDGRRWIAYRVGTWVVDRAVGATGLSVAALVTEPVDEIARLGGCG